MNYITEVCEVACRIQGVPHIVVGDRKITVIKLEKHWPVTVRPKELVGLTTEQIIALLEIKLKKAGLRDRSPIHREVD